jgi:hypothetical protein
VTKNANTEAVVADIATSRRRRTVDRTAEAERAPSDWVEEIRVGMMTARGHARAGQVDAEYDAWVEVAAIATARAEQLVQLRAALKAKKPLVGEEALAAYQTALDKGATIAGPEVLDAQVSDLIEAGRMKVVPLTGDDIHLLPLGPGERPVRAERPRPKR